MKPPDTDVIAVRPGEELDAGTVAAYLRGKLPGTECPLSIWQFGGGHANLTYLLRFGGNRDDATEYVLRRPPHGELAATSHDMGREYRVLSVLHRAFPPAPRAYLYCEDRSVIGAPFFVMERRRGTVVRSAVPAEFGGGKDPAVNRKLSEVLIDTLVELQSVDPAMVGLEGLGKPEGFMARQIDGWARRYERAKTRDMPAATKVAGWLRGQLPPSPPATLLHNDWRLDNMMLAAHDPGHVVAVFDWDMCTIGDPLADLGTLLALWVEKDESFAHVPMPSQAPGFMSRAEAVARYGALSGRDVSRVPYYHVFGLFKMAVVLQQIYYRYRRGQTADERFKEFDTAAEFLFEMAGAQVERVGI